MLANGEFDSCLALVQQMRMVPFGGLLLQWFRQDDLVLMGD